MADLIEEVFNLVDVVPERKMQSVEVQKRICEKFSEFHTGDVRRAIRLLVDTDRARLESGNILVLN